MLNNLFCFECNKDSISKDTKCIYCGKEAKVLGTRLAVGIKGCPNTTALR